MYVVKCDLFKTGDYYYLLWHPKETWNEGWFWTGNLKVVKQYIRDDRLNKPPHQFAFKTDKEVMKFIREKKTKDKSKRKYEFEKFDLE